MTPEEEKVLAATKRFYDAIEQMISGKGMVAMHAAWHHTPRVTSGHPTGAWASGWDEVSATWEVFGTFGKPENAGSSIRDLRVYLYGDVAYTTGVFVASPSFGSAQLNVTNVLHRADGEWKIIHHHADKAPTMERALEKMAAEG